MLSHFCDKLLFLTASSFCTEIRSSLSPIYHLTLGTASTSLKRNTEPGPCLCSRGWGYFTVPFETLPGCPLAASWSWRGWRFLSRRQFSIVGLFLGLCLKAKSLLQKNSLLFSPKRCKFRLWGSLRELVKLPTEPPCDVRQDRSWNHRAGVGCALILRNLKTMVLTKHSSNQGGAARKHSPRAAVAAGPHIVGPCRVGRECV